MKRLFAFTLLFVLLGQSAGCGFKLRSAQSLPLGMTQVHLTSVQQYSPLKRAVQTYLKLYQIPRVENISDEKRDQTVTLTLLPDSLDRRLLSLFPTGQVAEYELVLTIRFNVSFADKPAQYVEFDVTREYQDDPDEVLAKSRELELVLKELRSQAADRMIRMLPSLASS